MRLPVFLLLFICGFASGQTTATRPNLLLLLADDQRWDTLGCMGNANIHTPNIDELAAQGLRFENAFVTSSICAVSRACILLGQYPSRSGIEDFYTPLSEEQWEQSYPGQLRAAGYRIGFVGKWGVGATKPSDLDKVRPLFDDWAGFTDQGNYWHEANCDSVTANQPCSCPVPEGRKPYQPRTGREGIKHPVHLTTQIIPQKIEEILAAQTPGQPFCLSVSFKAPHPPFQDWDEHFKEDYRVNLPQRATANLDEAHRQPEFLRQSLEGDFGMDVVENPAHLRSWMRHYYRLVAGLDLAVGKIVQSLKTHHLDANTVIIYTSDNGFILGEHGLWGKWLMHEESIRVPLIIYDPRLPASLRGKTTQRMVLNLDLAPTLLQSAGVPIPAVMQGKSLLPLLEDPSAEFRTDWFYEHHFTLPAPMHIESSEGVRTGRWKYIRYIDQDPVQEQLFDLETDPLETQNLVGDERLHAQLLQLRARWETLAAEVRRGAGDEAGSQP